MADEPRHRRFWLEVAIVFAAWSVSGLLMANQYFVQSQIRGRPVTWFEALRPNLLESLLWALATLAIFWLARRFPLERGRIPERAAVHLAAALGLALVRSALMVQLGRRIEWVGERTFDGHFLGSHGQQLLFYALILGIAHAVLYHDRYRERERAAQRLAAGLAAARLQVLKAQLHPHFLFNTLNAISALLPPDAKQASRMIARLGDLLRIALEHEETQEVTLQEELAFLEPYLEIEQARLGDRLTVVMAIEPATLGARVPHLVLQPLVENAVRHGIAPRIAPGTVELRASVTPDGRMLELEVRDDGPGLDTGSGEPARKGVGLSNIGFRLEQLYDAHDFVVENHPEGGVVARIAIPFRTGEGPAPGPRGVPT